LINAGLEAQVLPTLVWLVNFNFIGIKFVSLAADHLSHLRGPQVVPGPQVDKRWFRSSSVANIHEMQHNQRNYNNVIFQGLQKC
jgi:hypothetical protein